MAYPQYCHEKKKPSKSVLSAIKYPIEGGKNSKLSVPTGYTADLLIVQ